MNTYQMIDICEQIGKDVENDAKEFDGKPFNGKTVAEYFGNHGAAIKVLSDINIQILKRLKELENGTITTNNT